MTIITTAAATGDALTDRVRATWTAGDFGRIAVGYESGAADFIARLEITSDERVLDVACGTGNLTVPAARAGATVSGVDIASNLLAQLELRAAGEGLSIELTEGNCEELPYDDASFDTLVSMFGVMFAARPERAAAELVRVCRPGGRIALANWTPAGFIGTMLKTITGYVPPAADVPSPLQWGDEHAVRERLGSSAKLQFTRRPMRFDYAMPPGEVVDLFRNWYGPTKRAFDVLDEPRRAALREDLTALWSEHNLGVDGTTRVDSEYLEVIAFRI